MSDARHDDQRLSFNRFRRVLTGTSLSLGIGVGAELDLDEASRDWLLRVPRSAYQLGCAGHLSGRDHSAAQPCTT